MSENDSLKDKLDAGVAAAKAGDKARARQLLEEVISEQPNNELAWIWLASTVNTLKERRLALERVLQINPNNTRAQDALNKLAARTSQGKSSTQEVPAVEEIYQSQRASQRAQRQATTSPLEERRQSQGVDFVNIALRMLVIVGGAIALLAGLSLFSSSGIFAPATSTPIPPTFTPTPTVEVTIPVVRVTIAPDEAGIPPTFTPTPTWTPTVTPLPTATPFPIAEFDALMTNRGDVETQPALYSMNGDGSSQQRIIDNMSDIVYSTSGRRVAMVREVVYEVSEENPEGGAVTEIFIADWNDLRNPQQVTTLQRRSAHSPSFSPEGNFIVFVSDWDGDDELWLLDIDSGVTTQLTENEGIDRDPDWSPVANNTIVFASDRGSPGFTEIYSLELSFDDNIENEVTRLTNDQGSSYSPRFSPDGTRITYASDREGDGDIYTMTATGQNPFLITFDDGAEDRSPAWTPDGNWVAFSSNREDEIFQFYLVDTRGREVIRLTNDDREAESITFRPELLLRIQDDE